jgi:hypothetical protein
MSTELDTTRATSPRPVRKAWLLLCWFSLWPLLGYLEDIAPWDLYYPALKNWYVTASVFFASVTLAFVVLERYSRRPDAVRGLQNMTLLAVTLIITFIGADKLFAVYTQRNAQFRVDLNDLVTGREDDVRMWDGELMPDRYAPTAANFFLYKPGQVRSADTYGEHYYPAMLKHPVLREEVLEMRHIDFQIDQYGFRNVDPPSNSDVFALGDSFCFGYHLTQSKVFTSLLKARFGKPVYNMGISGTGPLQEYLSLEYSLKNHPNQFKPRHLLWLVFEGNDLEDSYAEMMAPEAPPPPTFSSKLRAPLVWMRQLPWEIRDQSIVRRLAVGEVMLGTQPQDPHYLLDGEMLAYPLYHSQRFGYRLFRQIYIDLGRQPESLILTHPNRPRLDETFRRMRTLSRKQGFDVTVVVIPSGARLYKDDFEGLTLTAEPYFIQYLTRLAGEMGFGLIDLYEGLKPYAKDELIYQRDDTHWNERGHEIVAGIIGDALLGVLKAVDHK